MILEVSAKGAVPATQAAARHVMGHSAGTVVFLLHHYSPVHYAFTNLVKAGDTYIGGQRPLYFDIQLEYPEKGYGFIERKKNTVGMGFSTPTHLTKKTFWPARAF